MAKTTNFKTSQTLSYSKTEGTSITDILAFAAGKKPGELTAQDIERVAKQSGISSKDARRATKGGKNLLGSGMEYRLGEDGYNAFKGDEAQTKSSRASGNKKGFNVGDIVGLGNNTSTLAGLAKLYEGKYKESLKPKGPDETMNTSGENAAGTAKNRFSGEGFSWDNQSAAAAPSAASKGGKKKPAPAGQVAAPAGPTSNIMTNPIPVGAAQWGTTGDDFINRSLSGKGYVDMDLVNKKFKDASTYMAERGPDHEVYDEAFNKKLHNSYRQALASGKRLSADEIIRNAKLEDAITGLEIGATVISGGEYIAAKTAAKQVAKQLTQRSLAENLSQVSGKLSKLYSKATPYINKGVNYAKDLVGKAKNLTSTGKATAEQATKEAAKKALRQEEIDAAARASYNMDGFRKGGKLPSFAKGGKLPKMATGGTVPFDIYSLLNQPSALPKKLTLPKQTVKTNSELQKSLVQPARLPSQVEAPLTVTDANGDIVPAPGGSTAFEAKDLSTSGGWQPPKENNAGDFLTRGAALVAPWLTAIGTNKMLSKTGKSRYEDINPPVGVVSDIARPNMRLRARDPIGNDLLTQVAGLKFADAQQRDARVNYEIQNSMSKLGQRQDINDKIARNMMFNSQGRQSTEARNQYITMQQQMAKAQNLKEAAQATVNNIAGFSAQDSYVKSDKLTSLAHDYLRYPEGKTPEQLRWANEYLSGVPQGKKGLKIRV